VKEGEGVERRGKEEEEEEEGASEQAGEGQGKAGEY
jgi:hypothetical protein